MRDIGTAKAPSAAHFGCRYPSPPHFAGIVAMRDACAGRLFSLVSVIKRRKKLSVVSIVSRKGVVHSVGFPGGGFPFWSYVLRMFVPMR